MDYEKKYKESLNRARNLYNSEETSADVEIACEKIFPELVESEDERIRKSIINLVVKSEQNGGMALHKWESQQMLAWLEKQGEQKEATCVAEIIDRLTEKEQEILFKELEMQKVQKSINDMDEDIVEAVKNTSVSDTVEPKFKIGDWVVEDEPNNYARFIQILDVVNVYGKERYRISRDTHNDEDVVGCRFIENHYHSFTIQDANDGDVLVHSSFMFDDFIFIYNNTSILQAYCYYSNERNRFIVEDRGHHCPWNMQEVVPATKEQRDTLIKAMTDDGYTFDFEKKELKKIEQKPAWSEEDEEMLTCILDDIMPFGECPDYPTQEEKEYYYEGNRKVQWLKSLKERCTWKPSDEQLDALQYVYRNYNPLPSNDLGWDSIRTLELMYQDLKELKGE